MTDDELIALGLAECPDNDEPLEQYLAFVRWLLAHGAKVDEVRDAAHRGLYELFALRDQLLYLGATTYTATEFAARMHVSVDDMNEWWRLLRLPALTESDARFTEADIALARTARFYMQSLPVEHGRDTLRVLGSGMERIALGMRDVWRIAVEAPLEDERISSLEYTEITARMTDAAKDAMPPFLYGLYWRQSIAAVADNPVAFAGYSTGEADITVVFVDLVDFTGLARRIDAAELNAIVSAFDHAAHDVAHTHGGRLVKLLGDGAMFQFRDVARAIDAANAFVTGRPELPLRRAGIATGAALSRGGDFIGPVVNLAARPRSVAAPGDVVVDVRPPDAYDADAIDPVVLKGYDEPITPYRLRS